MRSTSVEGELLRMDFMDSRYALLGGIIPSSYHPIVELMPERNLQ